MALVVTVLELQELLQVIQLCSNRVQYLLQALLSQLNQLLQLKYSRLRQRAHALPKQYIATFLKNFAGKISDARSRLPTTAPSGDAPISLTRTVLHHITLQRK